MIIDPNTQTQEEDVIVLQPSKPLEDEWDNIHGDCIHF